MSARSGYNVDRDHTANDSKAYNDRIQRIHDDENHWNFCSDSRQWARHNPPKRLLLDPCG